MTARRIRCQDDDQSVFDRMLDVMLPEGGYVTVQVEAYFDESGSHAGSHVLCVAGYIMEKRQAQKLERDWNIVLRSKGLAYFRMSECAHGNGEFEGVPASKRVAIEKRMIAIIKARTAMGLAVTVNDDEFKELVPDHPGIGGSYSFAAHLILSGVREWLRRNPRPGKVVYFFETGHPSRTKANSIMEEIFAHPVRRAEYQYGGHGFVEKEGTPGVQAADLLAWQWYTDKRHQLEGKPRRKDCASLLEHPHVPMHIGRENMIEMTEGIARYAKTKGLLPEEVWPG